VSRPRAPEPATEQAAREAYFAGEISAAEYLERVLPAPDPVPRSGGAELRDDQFHRLRERLKARRKSG
jgi:hypothetical protein